MIDSENLIGVLELGTTYLKSVIARSNQEMDLEILGSSAVESQGIHNGVIINLDKATKSIRNCLSKVEKESKVNLHAINIVIDPKEFENIRLSKYRKIGGAKIEKDDIDFLLREAKNQIKTSNNKKSIVHIFNYNYIVDGKAFKNEPINVHADYLSHELTVITSPKNILKNINQAVTECDIEISKFISGIYALGVECLKDDDHHLGSTVIDFGFEKTSVGIFYKSALVHLATFPIGANHITKDISRGCFLTLQESENIKKKLDLLNDYYINKRESNLNDNQLPDNFFKESKFRKINKSFISSILQARLEEIFKLIKKEINFSGLKMTAGKNIFVSGGGSTLKNFVKFCSAFFSCNITRLDDFSLNDEKKIPEAFAACYGALKIVHSGFETEAIGKKGVPQKNEKSKFFSKIFGLNTR